LSVPPKGQFSTAVDNGQHLKGLKPGETAEDGFKRLEREKAELREANHILKKAMGFFVGR
jgi:transposase-like protein